MGKGPNFSGQQPEQTGFDRDNVVQERSIFCFEKGYVDYSQADLVRYTGQLATDFLVLTLYIKL